MQREWQTEVGEETQQQSLPCGPPTGKVGTGTAIGTAIAQSYIMTHGLYGLCQLADAQLKLVPNQCVITTDGIYNANNCS